VLGLALVSFTAPMDPRLREGCELVPDLDKPPEWELVRHDGKREGCALSHGQALVFATAAAEAFGVREDPIEGEFRPGIASEVLSLPEPDRKKLLRQGPVTEEALARLRARPSTAKARGSEEPSQDAAG
jgi:CRISPR-associated protein Csb1